MKGHGDRLTAKNHGDLIERKAPKGKTRDRLEDVRPKIKHNERGARNEYPGLLVSINQQIFFVQSFET
jgi:hypothetical protein